MTGYFRIFVLIILILLPQICFSENLLRSNISFARSPKDPVVQFADVSRTDALNSCPLETLPVKLADAVKQLVTQVSNTVNKIKETQTAGCTALDERFKGSQAIMQTALQNQFIASTASNNQQQINNLTQQALAVNQMMLTISDMLQRQCISAIDDRIVIQRLIGQVLTLSGLIMGGWQGITMAAGGQLLGNLPLFTNKIDQAIEIFQKYQEINQRGSFLCHYRQMQKTSCLLFSTPDDIIINGLDMSFKTGITHTTLYSISQIEKDAPNIYQDIQDLSELNDSSQGFIQAMQKPDVLEKGSLEAFQELVKWCQNNVLVTLQETSEYPQSVLDSVAILNEECRLFSKFEFPDFIGSELNPVLRKVHSAFYTLRSYYAHIRSQNNSKQGEVARTIESKKFFENLKNSLDEYRNLLSGNPNRTNYFRLVDSLGDSLARDSFKSLMTTNYDTLVHSNYNFLTKKLGLPFFRPNLSIRVRQRALIAMIDLCKTFDPTLSCLYIDTPGGSSFYKAWKDSCVGPKSTLCYEVQKRNERDVLIEDENYRAYYNSLCGLGDSLELRAFSM